MNRFIEILNEVERYGAKAAGRSEILKYLNGERITQRQMIKAKCYDCMGYFSDGRGIDCEIPTCSLYPLMPYRKEGEKYVKTSGRKISEEHKQKMQAARQLKIAK